MAAQAHGLKLDEVILMSAWVYSGPGQFAVLAPLAEGKSSLQVLVAGFLMNLRFLPMSTALAPYFSGVKRVPLLFASHVISASSFIVPYLQFQKEREGVSGDAGALQRIDGHRNLAFFLASAQPVFSSGLPAVAWVTVSRSAFHLDSKRRSNSFYLDILPGYWWWK